MLFEKEIPVIHLNISYDGGYTEEELYDMLQNAQNEEEREHVKHLYILHNNRQKGLHIVSECGFRQMDLEKFSLYNENALDLYKKSIEYYYNNDQEWFNYLVNSFISFEDKYNKNYYQEYLKSPEYVRVRLPKFGEDTLD